MIFAAFGAGLPGVDTTHDAQSGNYALKLFKDTLNNYPIGGDVLATFPCNSYVNLSGFYKLENPGPQDSAAVGFIATSWNSTTQTRDTIINDGIQLGAASNYTAFSFTPMVLNFNATIDTVQFLALYLPQNDQSSFKLDNLTIGTWAVGEADLSTKDQELKVYPNPTRDRLTIEYAQNAELIQLMNINGQVLLDQRISQSKEQIDLSSFAEGIYFLRIGEKVQRVVVSR